MANVCREDNMSVEVNLIMVYSSKDVYAGSEGDQLIVKDQIVEYILVCMVNNNNYTKHLLDWWSNMTWYIHTVLLHSETFPTSTCPFHVRIVKNELAAEFGFHIVHFCAKQRQLSLGIN